MIGLKLEYYWDLNPKQYKVYTNAFQRATDNRIKEIDYLNHILGLYMRFAFNDPNNYPKQPFSVKEKESAVMTAEQMQNIAKNITLGMNGKIKNNGTNN